MNLQPEKIVRNISATKPIGRIVNIISPETIAGIQQQQQLHKPLIFESLSFLPFNFIAFEYSLTNSIYKLNITLETGIQIEQSVPTVIRGSNKAVNSMAIFAAKHTTNIGIPQNVCEM